METCVCNALESPLAKTAQVLSNCQLATMWGIFTPVIIVAPTIDILLSGIGTADPKP